MAIGGRYEADQLYSKALALFQRNQISEAINRMNRAILLADSVAEFYAARGYFYLEDRDEARAEADFDEALRRNAYEALANFGKSILAYRRRAWPIAYDYALKAWAAQPQRPEFLYQLALCEAQTQRLSEAKSHMEEARAAYDRLKEAKWAREAERWLIEFERMG